MLKKRLLAVASFIETDDCVADIGCDHGYLSIYLKKNKNVSQVIASDINQNALDSAKKNIKKHHLEKEIPLILSNGLEQLPLDAIDTLAIAGMGTTTILSILKPELLKQIKKIILESNNDYPLLRTEMEKKGYALEKEILVFENNHYYFIMKYVPGKTNLNPFEIKYGYWKKENIPYYEMLLKKNETVLKQLSFFQFKIRKEKRKEIKNLKQYIKQKRPDC